MKNKLIIPSNVPALIPRLGEEFENKEHKLFEEDGFEAMVNRVADIEKSSGIYGLSQFTPQGIIYY